MFLNRFDIMPLNPYQIINPDIISVSHLMINPEIDETAANLWAVQEIEKSINKYFNLCKGFAIETVLSTDKYIKYVEEAKLKGYTHTVKKYRYYYFWKNILIYYHMQNPVIICRNTLKIMHISIFFNTCPIRIV